jgi:transcriptional regulator with XRE-family HTH domain
MAERPKLTAAQDLRRRGPPKRERVDAIKRGVELDVALHELRESRGITQEQVAARLETSRPNVSRIEREVDVRMSTLQRYVEALGGKLELVAWFPDGDSQTLLGGARNVTGRRRTRRSATERS